MQQKRTTYPDEGVKMKPEVHIRHSIPLAPWPDSTDLWTLRGYFVGHRR
jgi:hypothetical protein